MAPAPFFMAMPFVKANVLLAATRQLAVHLRIGMIILENIHWRVKNVTESMFTLRIASSSLFDFSSISSA